MELNFSNKPYFDDYKKEKGFHKILFKPGYAVQARELNQMQEIIQQQVARLGTHLFKNGSVVIPGQSKLNRKASYVILENISNDAEILTKLKDKVLYQTINGVNLKGRVLLTQSLGTKVLAILAYSNSATEILSGVLQNVIEFKQGVSITVENEPSILVSLSVSGPNAEPAVGPATFLTVESGVFFVDGYFVHTDSQTTLMGWNYSDLSVKSGFAVKKNIVTAYDDVSLFDNASGAPNEGAPGADRLSIVLELVSLGLNDSDTDFLELIRIDKNHLRVNKSSSQYNVLEETLARRTYDESGDYAVHGLEIKVFDNLKDERNSAGFRTVAEGGNDNLMAIEVGEGKAYVKGFEVENYSSLYLEVDKARTQDCVKVSKNVLQVNSNGEYIYLAPGNQFIDISKHPIIWLTNGFENTSAIIGYCIPKHLEAVNISGQTIFKLFGSFSLSQTQTYGWQDLGGWKLDDLKNGPVLQKLTLSNVVSNFVVSDGLPLTSHTGYAPYAWDSANKNLFVKKSLSAPVFNTSTQIVKAPASGYAALIEFKETFTDGTGDLLKLSLSNIKTIKDETGSINLQTNAGFTTTITTNASGLGTYNYVGDGVFVGTPVAAHTILDNAYFSNLVNITNNGKTLTINNATYPNAVFSISAQLSKNLAVKTKTLAEGSTVINTPSELKTLLNHKDVYKIKHVYVSANLATPATTANTDIGKYYQLVNNDTLDFYQNSIIQPRAGSSVPAGRLLVVYDYFLHSAGDVFTVDSYTALRDNPLDDNDTTHIGKIPVFSTKDKSYILSDYLDFRQLPRTGFFIIKATVTTGSPNINVAEDYSNVILTGSKIYSNGFLVTSTVASVDSQKIVSSTNSTYTGQCYVVVNASSATGISEPFTSQKSIWAPVSGQSLDFDASYFVDRWDRVVYYKNGFIKYLYGVPGITRYPETPIDAMSLATLIVPAYTRSSAFVKYSKDNNRRYTMRDIGKLENRIENLEYYTTLTLKELETKDLKIVDSTGLDRFKSGFFVSDFRDFGVFSPFDGGFKATLVPEKTLAMPTEYSESIDLVLNETSSSSFVIKGDKVFMPYSEVVEIQQPFGTTTETINPYLIIQWNPSMDLAPSVDAWIETEWAPSVTNIRNLSSTIVNESTIVNNSVNILNTMRSVSGFFGWTAPAREFVDLGRSVKTTANSVSTQGSVTSSTEQRSSSLLGSTVIPFMRSRVVRFSIKASKPNTRYFVTFDAKDVNALCRPVNTLTLVNGSFGEALVSDSLGNLIGDFEIPPNTFSTGAKTLALSDIEVLKFPDAGTECEASATYTANGSLRTMQEVIDITNSTVNTINTVVTLNRVTTVNRQTSAFINRGFPPPPPAPTPPALPPRPSRWWGGGGGNDPLAQSFFTYNVPAAGMFVTKLDLYFAKKDASAPVFIELREMFNGYPVNERIPGSLVGLTPAQVITSADSTVASSFVFEKPIFLASGKEFCFVVFGESSRYHVWISRLGEKVINEDKVIGEQPSLGTLFKSQNASTWTPFQLEDIKFRIHRAKFNTGTISELNYENGGSASMRRVSLSKIQTTNGSKFVTINHPNHGMETNGLVKISSESTIGNASNSELPSVVLNGVPLSQIYGNKIVKEIIDIDNYKIEVATAATKTGFFEVIGSYLYIESNINFYMYRLIADALQPPETNLRFFSNLVTGKDFDGGQVSKITIPEEQIKNQDSNALQQVALVQLSENETAKSIKIRTALTTANEYVCPVLSLKGNSVIVASLALNKPLTDTETSSSIELGNAASKLITQTIRLKTPADSLRIFTTESKLAADDIEVYYRTSVNRDIETKSWTKLSATNTSISYDITSHIEHERKIDALPEFDEFQIKIVLKGTDSVRRPSIKELRAIAVAG
jgi:Domain of unknown function (DUF4815)